MSQGLPPLLTKIWLPLAASSSYRKSCPECDQMKLVVALPASGAATLDPCTMELWIAPIAVAPPIAAIADWMTVIARESWTGTGGDVGAGAWASTNCDVSPSRRIRTEARARGRGRITPPRRNLGATYAECTFESNE